MPKFVETTTRVKECINEAGPKGICMSVSPNVHGHIKLVIGANWENRGAASIDKGGLIELIKHLQEIEDAME